jgi:hypothetical protein
LIFDSFFGRRSRGKNYRKPVFSQKTLDQNLTQILIEHNFKHDFKTPEKNTFSQQTRFSTDVMAQKTRFFCTLRPALLAKRAMLVNVVDGEKKGVDEF